MNAQQAIDIINKDKQHYMGLGDRNNVIEFARKVLFGLRNCPENAMRLVATFDELPFTERFNQARRTMQLFVPQLDNRIVPGVMDPIQIIVSRETARQRIVFDYVMDHFKRTGEALSGMPTDLLNKAMDSDQAA